MHALASALLHDSEAAHDVVHDVFAALLNSPPKTMPDTPYLLTSVKNRCLNRLKAIDVRERFRNLYLQNNDEADIIDDWPDEDTLAIIENCKKDMPPKCLEVFTLRFQEDLSVAEISQKTGTGERVIYKHQRHALELLKNKLNG